MNNKELLQTIVNKYQNVTSIEEKETLLKVNVNSNIDKQTLKELLTEVYALEKELSDKNENNIGINLKGLNTELLVCAISYSLTLEDLSDPLMILNIFNLIKIYNTLDQSFFENADIYVNSIEDLLDLRLELQEDLDTFIKQFSIYFISLFKSYNKLTYTPLDKHKPLPKLYKALFMSSDFLTLSGIFSVAKPFSTEECVYLDDAVECLINLQVKGQLGINFLGDLMERQQNDGCTTTE